ncbi:MAG: radical SAM protein [Candidatus Woesearchaeota archaeon]|jgi:radical SAM superfamily enzyme YgiQ (UPF0313 family)
MLDAAYTTVSKLKFNQAQLREVFEWRAQRVLARFADFSMLYGDNDIVPEYADTMVVVRVSEGCPRRCIYCPEPGKFKLYNEQKVRENMDLARRLQEKYHGPAIVMMDEGFINASDVLWHHLKSGGVDPLRIVQLFKKTFPELRKIYSFVGVPNFNQISRDDKHYLDALFNYDAINRVLIGIETCDDDTSRFLGKNESREEKVYALRTLASMGQSHGVKVKAIIQIGMTGKGFYFQDSFISSRTALERTAKSLYDASSSSTYKRPFYVLISRYVPVQRTLLTMMHKNGRIVPYDTSQGVEEDVHFFITTLKKMDVQGRIRIEDHYQVALQE